MQETDVARVCSVVAEDVGKVAEEVERPQQRPPLLSRDTPPN